MFFFYKLPANNLQFSAALKISPAPRVLSFQFPSQPSVFIRFTAIPSYCQLWPISIRRIFFGPTPTYRGSLVKIHARPRLFNTIEVQFRSINFDHVLENNTVSMGSFHPFIDSICVFFFTPTYICISSNGRCNYDFPECCVARYTNDVVWVLSPLQRQRMRLLSIGVIEMVELGRQRQANGHAHQGWTLTHPTQPRDVVCSHPPMALLPRATHAITIPDWIRQRLDLSPASTISPIRVCLVSKSY